MPAKAVVEHLAVNIDLAPTFAELGGVETPDFVDGRSLVRFLRGRELSRENWRQGFFLKPVSLPGTACFRAFAGRGLRTSSIQIPASGSCTIWKEIRINSKASTRSGEPAVMDQLAAWRACGVRGEGVGQPDSCRVKAIVCSGQERSGGAFGGR